MNQSKLYNQNLIAPCGLYCGECEAFQDERCGGCISRKGLCLKYSGLCKIYDCCINSKKLRFCCECQEFPCRNFKFFEDTDYDWFGEVVENLKKIKAGSAENFLQEQAARVEDLIKCAEARGVKHCVACPAWPCPKMSRPPLGPA